MKARTGGRPRHVDTRESRQKLSRALWDYGQWFEHRGGFCSKMVTPKAYSCSLAMPLAEKKHLRVGRGTDLIFVVLQLQVGWRGSPGWLGVLARALRGAHRATSRASVGTSATAEAAKSHVGVMRSARKAVVQLLLGCWVPRVQGGG